MKLPIVRLQPQRHKRASGGHPWIFSNEVVMDTGTKAIKPGSMADFRAHDGRVIGKGSFNPHTLIAGRIFTRAPIQAVDGEWIKAQIEDALALREKIIPEPFYRLIHAEADGLPGLIVDRYGTYLSVQLNTAGIEKLWPQIETALKDVLKPKGIVLRNDSGSRAMEGLPRETKIAFGEIPEIIEVRENGLTYFADIAGGQKTGWYFDQRDNHAAVAKYCGKAASVLDLYTHAGGFALLAAQAGAKKVTGVDSSEATLTLAQKAAAHNKLSQCHFHKADVFEALERRAVAKEKHDVVIADPPAFVKAKKDATSGAKGYRKLTRLCAAVTAPQGLLFIASCSHNMDLNAFTEQVAAGLSEAGRTGRILHTLFAAPDHPVHPYLPESAYLKGVLVRLD
jgi:23S rRNA (cytosine1962-C5)-methyltransferase